MTDYYTVFYRTCNCFWGEGSRDVMLTTYFQPLSWLCINRIISLPHLSPCHPAPE